VIATSATRTGLVAWVALLSGIDAKRVQWGDEPTRLNSGSSAAIFLTSASRIGTDEHRPDYTGGELRTRTCGNRRATISVRFDSYDQRIQNSAFELAEKFSSALASPRSRERLSALGIALVGDQSFDHGGAGSGPKAYSGATVDVFVTYAVNDLPTDPEDFIETVEIDGVIDDVEGNPALEISQTVELDS
jgi:hypothetical protein